MSIMHAVIIFVLDPFWKELNFRHRFAQYESVDDLMGGIIFVVFHSDS